MKDQRPSLFLYYRRKERQQEELIALTRKVVKKLIEGVSEGGTVSLFHNKTTGIFETAIFAGFFTSPKLPHLQATLWKDDIKPSEQSLRLHKSLFGVTDSRIYIQATEWPQGNLGGRSIMVVQQWDMGPDDWDIVYRRNADKEAGNAAIPRSNGEKMKFLREILETTIDTAANEKHFGRPYVKGDS